MKNLRSLLSAVCLSTSFFLSPIQGFTEKEIFFNETYPVVMEYSSGKEAEEEVKIQAFLDEEIDTLYLIEYTQDYNRRNWKGNEKEKLPVYQRHTYLNNGMSRVFALLPPRVKISEIGQKIFAVPQYRWVSELKPYEKRQKTQLIIETTDWMIDKVISKIPFLGKIFDKYIKDAKEKEEEYYDAIFEEIEPDYIKKRIYPHIPENLIGYTETAREYAIEFDTGNVQDEIPIYIWLRLDLGDPSNPAYGYFPRYGKLENILIKFNLNESNIKREELHDYFFHKEELKYLNIAKKNIEGTKSNPAIITIKNLEQEERELYEEDKVVRIGVAEYILRAGGDATEKELLFDVVQFETEKSREDFMEKRIDDLKYPSFYKEAIFSCIEKPTLEEVFSPLGEFSEEQILAYVDLILNYMERTEMEVMLDKDSEKSKKLLWQIKKYQMGEKEEDF